MNTDELTTPTPTSSFAQPLTFHAPPKHSPNASFHCLLCNVEESNSSSILEHLLQVHSIVIADVNKIANVPRYLLFWKEKLSQKPLSEYTSQIDTRPTPSSASVKSYYLLSDILPEDKEIRKELRQQKLSEVLAIQQQERSDTCFEKKCLFCNALFKGDRSQLIAHMFQVHKFNIGRPDNLVNIGEFVDILQQRLDNLQCLYCEKTYKSSAVLKQHMRKKKHFKINPKNSIYDNYYVVNYLEPGKNWQELQKELDAEPEPDDEDRSLPKPVPHFLDDVPSDTAYTESGSEIEPDEDGNWEDWEEEDDEVSACVCLFCPASLPSPEQTIAHLKAQHSFDLFELQKEWKIDYYDCIKMINYIRRCVVELECPFCKEKCETQDALQNHLATLNHCQVPRDAPFFKDSQYLFPTYENDSLLTAFDIGGDQDNAADTREQEQLKKAKEDLSKRRAQLARELERMGLSHEVELRQLPWGNTPASTPSTTPASTPSKPPPSGTPSKQAAPSPNKVVV